MSKARRVVVITGGTQGLGRALAFVFGQSGYAPICIYHAHTIAADALAVDFHRLGIDGRCVQADIAMDFPALAEIDSGPITLINNACPPFAPTPFHLVDPTEVQRGLDVMVTGSVRATQSLLKPMLRQGGTVINILSQVTNGVPPKGFAGYVAAKYALMGLGRALAAEYGDRGIRVLSVSPGFMRTALTAEWPASAIAAHSEALDPDVVAHRVLALAEDATLPHRGENYVI